MLMPSIFGEKLFDDWMDFPFEREFYARRNPQNANQLMKTDIREKEGSYELDVDFPGYKKEDLKLQLENGYLTISAVRNTKNEEKDEKGKYIRQERYSGAVSRSFYVGETITEEDIHAKFEDGILKLSIPKEDAKAVEAKKYITIEG